MRQIATVSRVVAIACLAAAHAPAEEQRELRVALIDLVGVAPPARDAMWREARRLLAPAGVGLRTRSAKAAEQRDDSELAVVLIPERSRAPTRGAPPLGAVQTVLGFTTIWIDVAAVAAVADARRGLDCCGAETRRLGIALGRVLTHEVVHALAPGLGHTREGLLAARINRSTLVDDPAPRMPSFIAKRPNQMSER